MSCMLPPVCAFCVHLLNNPEQECQAFAEIPDDIMLGKSDHLDPYEGDGGLRFELKPDDEADFEEINEIRSAMGLPAFRCT
ncbi:MAG TPA: hypothetical protein PLM98_07675, partial [Thiolinea sp.]|nr:hypothetical protein [Thiolinea sp.]